MKILFTICGRAGSKGIKNKNIRDFLGVPLPYYTLAAIELYKKRHSEVDVEIVVNTDSQELITLLKAYNCDVEVIVRSKELGGDTVPKIAVIENCMDIMSERKNKHYDMIIDLDITSPLRTINDIENLIEKKTNTDCDIVFSVTDSRRNPYFNMVTKKKNGYGRVIDSDFNCRQEAPEIFDMNASMYAYSPDFLRQRKNIFDGKCDIIKMYDTAVLDLDHEGDFELMEVIAEYLFSNRQLGFAELKDELTKTI